jgi:nucleosome-remodeling factor subunit BPTF
MAAAKSVKEEPMDTGTSGLAGNVSLDDEEIDVEGDREAAENSTASDKLINSFKGKKEVSEEGEGEESNKAAVSGDSFKDETGLDKASTSTETKTTDNKDNGSGGEKPAGEIPIGIKDALSVAQILASRPGISMPQAQQAIVQAIMKMSVEELRARMPPVRKSCEKYRLPRSTKAAAKQRNKALKKAGLPLAHRFQTASKRKSIFVLENHELVKLARRAGFKETPGFNYNCKMNNVGWIYPCPRPFFKTAWRYRTQTLSSLAAAGLQLHIMWGCIRWDDMAVKPPAGGTNTISTETEITTTELLKRRDTGPNGLRSEFLVRKIVVPLGITSQPKGMLCIFNLCGTYYWLAGSRQPSRL